MVDAGHTLSHDGQLSADKVANQGSIVGTGALGGGVFLGFAGTLTNTGTAAAISGEFAVGGGGTITVTNQGSITGGTDALGAGVYMIGGGTVTNQGTAAHISGGRAGVLGADLAVTNQGTITASGTTGEGIILIGAGRVTNSGAAARISGGYNGVLFALAAGTVSNAGGITAEAAARRPAST